MNVKSIATRKSTVKSTAAKRATPSCIVKKATPCGTAKIRPTSISKKTKPEIVKTAKYGDAEISKIVAKIIDIYDTDDILKNGPTIGIDDKKHLDPEFPVPYSDLIKAIKKLIEDYIKKHYRPKKSNKKPTKKTKK
jgi:hypothetical protein